MHGGSFVHDASGLSVYFELGAHPDAKPFGLSAKVSPFRRVAQYVHSDAFSLYELFRRNLL